MYECVCAASCLQASHSENMQLSPTSARNLKRKVEQAVARGQVVLGEELRAAKLAKAREVVRAAGLLAERCMTGHTGHVARPLFVPGEHEPVDAAEYEGWLERTQPPIPPPAAAAAAADV